MTEIIQAQYDTLEQLAMQIYRQADQTRILLRKIESQVDTLAKSWEGSGADAFQREIDEDILPALKKLASAFEIAGLNVRNITTTFQEAEEEAVACFPEGEEASRSNLMEWVHGILDGVGFIPGIGEIADGTNAVIYLVEGRYWEAGISAAAMLPVIGDVGKAGKWSLKAGREMAEAAAERSLRETVQRRIVTEAEMIREIYQARRVPLGRIPADELPSAAWGTTKYGDAMHHEILPDRIREAFPDANFRVTGRGVEGPDMIVRGGDPGFDWIEIKPDTESGVGTFVRKEWEKSEVWGGRGRLVVYDKDGNIRLIDFHIGE
ncbi:MAG: WXG100 family type VII secretion target [Anaerolineales bacterium]|nr:WXG100 family type VII secretion target [Anaerolineales bacterium]